MSGVFEKALEHTIWPETNKNTPIAEHHFQIFGDLAYDMSPIILSPFAEAGDWTAEEQEWNNVISKAQISIKHAFGLILKEWPFI